MIIMILENVPVGLRGELSRWLIEPRAGVFVGHVSGWYAINCGTNAANTKKPAASCKSGQPTQSSVSKCGSMVIPAAKSSR